MIINTEGIYRRLRKDKKIPPGFEEFRDIIQEFNKLLVKKILEGYRFDIPHVKGRLEIKKKERTQKSKKFSDINWEESKKLKKELIEKGIKPYKKEDDSGEKWFVYFTGDYYLWNWYRNLNARYQKNIMKYKFKPTTINSRKLSKAIKENPIADISYDTHN